MCSLPLCTIECVLYLYTMLFFTLYSDHLPKHVCDVCANVCVCVCVCVCVYGVHMCWRINHWCARARVLTHKACHAHACRTDSIRNTLLPSNRSLLPSSRSLLPSNRSLLPSSRSLLPYSRSLLPSSRSLLPSDRSLLPSSRSLLPSDRSLLPSSRSLLPSNRSHVMPMHAGQTVFLIYLEDRQCSLLQYSLLHRTDSIPYACRTDSIPYLSRGQTVFLIHLLAL